MTDEDDSVLNYIDIEADLQIDHRPLSYWKNIYNDNTRSRVLDKAKSLVNGERQQQYGPPHKNFARVARLWSVTFGIEVKPWQVALALGQLKDARFMEDPQHHDSAVDALGYRALMAELGEE